MSTLEHLDTCAGDVDCTPLVGVAMQPPAAEVEAAIDELGEAPWCVIRERASDMRDAAEFVVADRAEDEPCERGTVGCCVDHGATPDHDACEAW